MGKDKKKSKVKYLNERLQPVIKLVGAIVFLTPLIWTGIKNVVPYIEFVNKGPELISSVKELEDALLVTTGALSANAEKIDSTIYKATWRGVEHTAIIRRMRSGDIYIFIQNGHIGERVFKADRNIDRGYWSFTDFYGEYVKLEDE